MSHVLPTITALGTRWLIEIFDDATDNLESIHSDILTYITTYEHRYSRFLRTSLVSQINHTGVLENPDHDIITLLTFGQSLYQKTNGTFNILVGAELSARGYNSAYTFTPEQPHSTQIIPSPLEALSITDQQITLTAGGIDLGGFGKGYLLDLVASRLKEVHNLPYFIINAGGDMYGTSDNGSPITIYLEHPTDPTQSIFTSTLCEQGFAASSSHKRRWTYQGMTHTHLVATTTHIDDLDRVGTYVIARSAVAADVLATTSLLSPTPATAYMEEEAAIVARFDTGTGELTSSAALPTPVVQS